MAIKTPLRVRLDDTDEARINELIQRTGLDASTLGRAALRLLYAEIKRRGEAGFIVDELSDAGFEQILKEIRQENFPALPPQHTRLNEVPQKKKVA